MGREASYRQVAEIISGGVAPESLVDITKALVKEDEIDLILAFKEKRSQC